ncbi:ADP-ribosyltransferase [Actinomadura fibrosa]|uniref:ADP-ribosyltransferase n=1 Tax=Actinomadura fibrosa TaxID=111802 RepID=A0ABW2XMZ3_9ACTN|nr:ADP-ribosyltransferase [Actinomadura fibrosa]
MIDPNAIPIPKAVPDDVEAAGKALKGDGTAIAQTGHDIHADWQALSEFYIAPESPQLLAATKPVETAGNGFKGEVTTVGDALVAFAGEIRPIITRLQGLKTSAQNFRSKIDGDDDWRKDEDKVNEHNKLNNDVLAAIAQYQEAERSCANKITGIFGGTHFVPADGKPGQGQQGYGLGQAPKDVETPWAKPQEHDKPWYQDAWDGVWDFGKGILTDLADLVGLHGENGWLWDNGWGWGQWWDNMKGNYTQTLRDLGGLVGLHGEHGWVWDSGWGDWWGNFSGAWVEIGHSFVPWREWGDRPGYVITQSVLNIGSLFIGVGEVKLGLKLLKRGHGEHPGRGHGDGGDGDTPHGDRNGDGRVDSGELDAPGGLDANSPTTRDLQNQLDDLDFDTGELQGLDRAMDDATGLEPPREPARVGGDDPGGHVGGDDDPGRPGGTDDPGRSGGGNNDPLDNDGPGDGPLDSDGSGNDPANNDGGTDTRDPDGQTTDPTDQDGPGTDTDPKGNDDPGTGDDDPGGNDDTPGDQGGDQPGDQPGTGDATGPNDPPNDPPTGEGPGTGDGDPRDIPPDHFGDTDPTKEGPLGDKYKEGVYDPPSDNRNDRFDPNERKTAETRADEGRLVTRLPPHPRNHENFTSMDALERRGPHDPGTPTEYKEVGENTRSAVDDQLKRAFKKFKPQPDGSLPHGDIVMDGRQAGLSADHVVNGLKSRLGRMLGSNNPILDRLGRIETYLGDGSKIVYEDGRITRIDADGEHPIGQWDPDARRFTSPDEGRPPGGSEGNDGGDGGDGGKDDPEGGGSPTGGGDPPTKPLGDDGGAAPHPDANDGGNEGGGNDGGGQQGSGSDGGGTGNGGDGGDGGGNDGGATADGGQQGPGQHGGSEHGGVQPVAHPDPHPDGHTGDTGNTGDGSDPNGDSGDAPDLDPGDHGHGSGTPGHMDDDGVRRFDTDDDGELYGERVLGETYRNLSPETQHAIREYTRYSWPYNPILRANTWSQVQDIMNGWIRNAGPGWDLFEMTDRRVPTLDDVYNALHRTDLTPTQRQIVHDIVNSADPGTRLEQWLRSAGQPGAVAQSFGRFPTLDDIHDRMRLIDEALDNPLPEGVEVQRGLHSLDFMEGFDPNDPHALEGTVQRESSYMSTSLGAGPTQVDGQSFRYRMHLSVPEGAHGLWMGRNSVYDFQRELVLPRNTTYRITKVTPNPDGTFDINAEVLPPGA